MSNKYCEMTKPNKFLYFEHKAHLIQSSDFSLGEGLSKFESIWIFMIKKDFRIPKYSTEQIQDWGT